MKSRNNIHHHKKKNEVNNTLEEYKDIIPDIEIQIENLLKKFHITKYDYKITHFLIDIIQNESLKILKNAKHIKKNIYYNNYNDNDDNINYYNINDEHINNNENNDNIYNVKENAHINHDTLYEEKYIQKEEGTINHINNNTDMENINENNSPNKCSSHMLNDLLNNFNEDSAIEKNSHIDVVNNMEDEKATSALAHQFILHAKTLGIKTIYTDHSLYSFSDKGCIHVNKLLKYCINDVDHSICVSHTNRENLVLRTESNPYKTSVIGNALDTTKFVPCISKRPKFPRINIIVISRLTYRKGIDLIVKVIPLVCQKYPFIKFIIGGEGPKRLLLEEMREKYHLHNSVVLLGKVKQENVKNILQTGHIFLNTSLTEAFCIAIIEAASCGLLVISTDVGGISEVLPHDMMILAKPNHIELCKAVDKALKIVQKVDSNLFHERQC
ncbi:hypothetical protein PFFCH_03829 [Plasmodium falciparum FCH/4]|uniref:Glycosyl transferase family 1 domain-containing protein n=1 Tax=Plasmodium falciparum FCH/4 TaxID=1036724 RepID=A0A024VKG2_PLAFA|nr:hypothetical protein PFFCH_03829 [Plasmodium falciparum FCH/4]